MNKYLNSLILNKLSIDIYCQQILQTNYQNKNNKYQKLKVKKLVVEKIIINTKFNLCSIYY